MFELLRETYEYLLANQGRFWNELSDHLALSLGALTISVLLCLPLGIWAARRAGQAQPLIDESFRTVLRLRPHLAPIKVAVFPLKRNHDGLVETARGIRRSLQSGGRMRTVYDDTGAIGKLYRRQDEIGTPFCVTVDFQTLEDGTVTVRERDSMQQERVPVAELQSYLAEKVA